MNFGTSPATLAASGELLFTTPGGACLSAAGLDLPPHAGALVRLDAASA